ncbi:MAG: hypothetical protein E7113_06460 [Bacteroidales bacterium]|nr:hypothetical protein [Bacteroidales bacterium]
MKTFNYSYAALVAVAALLASALTSCVNEEYDVEDLNTEITVGAEGLTLPIGSTSQLKLKDLIAGMDEDMLQVLDGGAYALRIGDTLNLGDQLPDLKDVIDIPDVEFADKTDFSLSDMDMSSLTMDGQTFDYSVTLADADLLPEIKVPEIEQTHENMANVWEYGKAARDMKLDLGEAKSVTTKSLFKLPDITVTEKVEVPDLPEAVVEKEQLNLIVKSEAPEGISEISDVMMGGSSALSVRLSVVNSFLSTGTVLPDLEMDFGGLMTLEDGKGYIVMADDFILDENNEWTVLKEFGIKQINIEADDWDEEGLLELAKTFTVKGKVAARDVTVDPESVSAYDKTQGMKLRVDVGFENMIIESMMMTLDGIDPVVEKMEIPLSIDDIELPDGVKSVDRIEFTESSVLEMMVKLNSLDIEGLETRLEKMVVTFPEGFEVSEAVDGKVEFSADLAEGLDKTMHVEMIEFPDPVDGKISFDGKVQVEAVVTVGGRICSADVPYTEDTDGSFMFEAVSHLDVEEYYVDIDGLSHELDMDFQEFRYDLPDGVLDIGTFEVTVKGSPVMTIDLKLPQANLDLKPAEEGVSISFPEFIRFKDVDPEYGFDRQTNSITLKGEIPEKIELPVEKLVITPECDAETGKYYADGHIDMAGALTMPSGMVKGSDVEDLLASEVSVDVVIPELMADKVSFEHFKISLDENFDFVILKAGTLPEEVKSVSRIDLSDVEMVLDLKVDNMPDLGTESRVGLNVTMPEMIVLDDSDSRVNGNVLTIDSKISDGKIALDPIKVLAIDLAGYDFSAGWDLAGNIALSGSIEAENPEIDLASLDGDIIIDLKTGIRDIDIERIEANVDYQIDGIDEKIELSDLPDFMKGDGFVLDLVNPHIVMKTVTNLGIPVKGEIMINPVTGGTVDEEGQIKTVIELPYTETAEQTKSVTFWFGGDKEACPADYTFVQADIRKLIRRLPDQLEFSLVAGTDPDQSSVVEPSADYVLDVEYDFVIPLEFGDDLYIEITDTIPELPEILGQILEKNSVQLAGSITSSLPLALEMQIDMLDADDRVMPVEKPAVQAISACNSDGSAVETPLDLTIDLKDDPSVSELSALKVTFKVTSPNTSGIPVDEADFVQADIKFAVPEGLTLDLEALTEN